MIYFLLKESNGLVKIGYTENYHERLRSLTVDHGKLTLLALKSGTRRDEKDIHRAFASDHSHAEWFKLSASLRQYIEDVEQVELPPAPKLHAVRLSKETKQAMKKVASELMRSTGKRFSGDDVARHLVRQIYPEIAIEESI